jgi:hypothetical protein
MNGYRTTAANTQNDLCAVYRIRGAAYLHCDADIPAGATITDEYDEQPNCLSHLLFLDDAPIGTIRTSIYASCFQWMRVQALDLFDTAICEHIGEMVPVVQSSHFAIVPEGRCHALLPKLLLYQRLIDVAAIYSIDSIITIVRNRPTQIAFYSKAGFRAISQPCTHPQVNRSCILLHGRVDDFSQWVTRNFNDRVSAGQ